LEVWAAEAHSNLEEKITDEQMEQAVKAVRELFKKSFGEAALKDAVKEPDPKKPQ
jgi:Arc/MetJ family transcription regulator